ncbi:hypothetical protein MJO28_003967 [Puccinia striiformis f. sp. tritici]|uniref:Uncharacterized protein n=1 Tax=Puccinia striiformis f. sp. tritici TaxID=168172 RepID=A0ACC0EPS0_9BASI|nr:hypothetical protein MJO28_003967 [Puccinia striiformis f. sp. tritici]
MANLSRIDNSESGNTLQVIVTHQDWDSEVCIISHSHRHQSTSFPELDTSSRLTLFIRSAGKSTSLAVSSTSRWSATSLQFCKLYIVASLISNTYQDLNFQVTSVSLTSGHQAVQANTNPDAGGTPSASGGRQILVNLLSATA